MCGAGWRGRAAARVRAVGTVGRGVGCGSIPGAFLCYGGGRYPHHGGYLHCRTALSVPRRVPCCATIGPLRVTKGRGGYSCFGPFYASRFTSNVSRLLSGVSCSATITVHERLCALVKHDVCCHVHGGRHLLRPYRRRRVTTVFLGRNVGAGPRFSQCVSGCS